MTTYIDIVYECPKCKNHIKCSVWGSMNTFGTIIKMYSDFLQSTSGNVEGGLNYVGCNTCKTVSNPSDMRRVPESEANISKPEVMERPREVEVLGLDDPDYEAKSAAMKCRTKAYNELLHRHLPMGDDEALMILLSDKKIAPKIRKQLLIRYLWLFNHDYASLPKHFDLWPFRSSDPSTEKTRAEKERGSGNYAQYTAELIEILKATSKRVPEEQILLGEVLRETGRFDEAIQVLDKIQLDNVNLPHAKSVVKQIRERAVAHIPDVFELDLPTE